MQDPTTASDAALAAELARLSQARSAMEASLENYANYAETARQRLRKIAAEMAPIEAELRARLNAKHDGLPTPEA